MAIDPTAGTDSARGRDRARSEPGCFLVAVPMTARRRVPARAPRLQLRGPHYPSCPLPIFSRPLSRPSYSRQPAAVPVDLATLAALRLVPPGARARIGAWRQIASWQRRVV